MKITFCGAAQTVTGSCYFVETAGCRFLVDCGMFQGPKHIRALNFRSFAFDPAEIDFVILTHAHIDHSGLLPKLVSEGFCGNIYATEVTAELSAIMLPDSAHIQEHDVEIANRKGKRSGRPAVKPLYTVADAERVIGHFKTVEYGIESTLADNVRVVFHDAGHILGSAIAEVFIREDSRETRMVFSGDLGQYNQPIVRDPEYIHSADYLFIESTYGLRNRVVFDKEEELARAINQTVDAGGNCVIPAFAVGRTQLVLYYLLKLTRAGKIPKIPVYLDSPLGIAATRIFGRHPEVYDEEARENIRLDRIMNSSDMNLHIAVSVEESKRINETPGSKIVISSSGMADAGRILHHLKHNLWSARNAVLFMGYQAEGTVGRRLIEGAERVKIAGEEIVVHAKIHNFEGFSAHADREELLNWLKHFEQAPRNVFVMHGEPEVARQFAQDIKEYCGFEAFAPALGDAAEITATGLNIVAGEQIAAVAQHSQLQNFFVLVETDYMDLRRRLEILADKEPARIPDIARRLQKLHNIFAKMIGKLG